MACSMSMARRGGRFVPNSPVGPRGAGLPSTSPTSDIPTSSVPAEPVRHVKIQEADAKSLLLAQGLPVPPWAVAHTVPEARAAAGRFLGEGASAVVIKAQVLVGGRGKAGGVKLADDEEAAERVAGEILGMEIKGIPVRKVLVAPAADIVREYYMSAVLDRAARRILLMGSAEGGVEIEQVARRPARGDRPPPRRPDAGAARLPGSCIRLRHGSRRPPQGCGRDRQGPRPDDARLRRRPRRDQSAGDRSRDRRDGRARRAPGLPGRQGDARRLRPPPPPRARGAARSRRGGSGRPRGARGGAHVHQARWHDRLHGQRGRPGDDDDGSRQARRRRAGQLPRHRRRGPGGPGRGGDADHPRPTRRSTPSWSTSSVASPAATRWREG